MMRKRTNAFRYAFRGLRYFFIETAHAKFHLTSAIAICVAGFYWKISTIEWSVILLCIALVLCLEAVNSAIEYTVDIASPSYHKVAEKAKDVAAGAVLIASFFSVVIALLIFIPKIF